MTLKGVGNSAVKAAALAELRRKNAHARSAAYLVDLVADVDDIEPGREIGHVCPFESLAEPNIDRVIGWHRAAIGAAIDVLSESATADHFQIRFRFGLGNVVGETN